MLRNWRCTGKSQRGIQKAGGNSSDFSSSVWSVSPEVYGRGGLPAQHTNLYREMMVRTQGLLIQQRQAFGELIQDTARQAPIRKQQVQKQPEWPFPAAKGCRRQQIIDFLGFRSRLDPLWQKCFLWSTSHWAPHRATCWHAMWGGSQWFVRVSSSFGFCESESFCLAEQLFTPYIWITQGSALNNHNLNTLNWVVSDKLRSERLF